MATVDMTEEHRGGPTMRCKVNLFPYLILLLGLPHATLDVDLDWDGPVSIWRGKSRMM